MTRNPYAHPIDDEPLIAQRVSGLSIASLVFGLLCCIPGSGFVGVVLGISGLVAIGRSRGRLSGRGFALAGLLLGLLGTLLWIGGALGLLYQLNQFTVYERVVESAQRGDHAAFRKALSPAASAALTDAQIDDFGRHTADQWGTSRGVPQGVPDWFASYSTVLDALEHAKIQVPAPDTIPLPLKCDRGLAPAVFNIDPRSTGPSGAASVDNIGIVGKDGALIWLRDPSAPATPKSPAPPATGEAPAPPSAPTSPAPTAPEGGPSGPEAGTG